MDIKTFCDLIDSVWERKNLKSWGIISNAFYEIWKNKPIGKKYVKTEIDSLYKISFQKVNFFEILQEALDGDYLIGTTFYEYDSDYEKKFYIETKLDFLQDVATYCLITYLDPMYLIERYKLCLIQVLIDFFRKYKYKRDVWSLIKKLDLNSEEKIEDLITLMYITLMTNRKSYFTYLYKNIKSSDKDFYFYSQMKQHFFARYDRSYKYDVTYEHRRFCLNNEYYRDLFSPSSLRKYDPINKLKNGKIQRPGKKLLELWFSPDGLGGIKNKLEIVELFN